MTAGSRRGASPLNADGSIQDFPPAAFGPFRVLHQVGAGSLGPVFRAHDPAEGRLVAIKAFKLDLTPEQARDLAIALEDLVAAQPRHQAMAAAVAAGVTGSTAYLAQEYVPGEALDAVLRQYGPPAPGEALAILARLAEALDRAAGEGIHHGTLHPRDILVSDDGDTRLIDLGVAQALERCGVRTPTRRPYAAPERVADEPWGGPADIFTLGAVAFELLTGRRITGPGLPPGALEGITVADNEEIGRVLARALHESPAERFPSAVDLIESLRPALEGASRTTPARKRKSSAGGRLQLPLEPAEDVPASAEEGDELRAFSSEGEEPPLGGALAEARVPYQAVEPAGVAPMAGHIPAAVAGADVPPLEADVSSFDNGNLAASPSGRYTDWEPPSEFARHEPEPEPEPEPVAPVVMGPPFGGGEARLDSPRWDEPSRHQAPQDRGRLLPLLVAILVGLAAGFGWGYWTAWRILGPESTTVETADASPAATATAAADPTADTSREVQDPEVIGERGLPSPAAGARRAAPERSTSSTPGSAPVARTPARPATRPAAGAETAPAGRVLVRSEPAGARVLVDGRVRGTTPAALRDLPFGAVTLTVERDGYRPETRRISLTRERPSAAVTVQLNQTGAASPGPARAGGAAAGVLVVESRPSGARVTVDGRPIGTTPLSLPEVSSGRHTVRLEMSGFRSWSTSIEVAPGERTRVAASLEMSAPQ